MGSSGASGARKHEGHRPRRGPKQCGEEHQMPRGLHLKKLGNGEGEMSLKRRDENSVSGGAGGDGESILVPFSYGSDYTDWGKWWRVKGK